MWCFAESQQYSFSVSLSLLVCNPPFNIVIIQVAIKVSPYCLVLFGNFANVHSAICWLSNLEGLDISSKFPMQADNDDCVNNWSDPRLMGWVITEHCGYNCRWQCLRCIAPGEERQGDLDGGHNEFDADLAVAVDVDVDATLPLIAAGNGRVPRPWPSCLTPA